MDDRSSGEQCNRVSPFRSSYQVGTTTSVVVEFSAATGSGSGTQGVNVSVRVTVTGPGATVTGTTAVGTTWVLF